MSDPCKELDTAEGRLEQIVRLVRCLRSENGCPWDRKQTPESLSVYLVEEIFELVDAIEQGDSDAVCEELGDVLFQITFVAGLFEEQGRFTMADVICRNLEKMVRRHPHVFGDAKVDGAETVRRRWGEIKKAEKRGDKPRSILDSIPSALPALMRAYRISERAAHADFDWEELQGVMEKAEEEWAEFKAARVESGEASQGKAAMEFGDILFTLVNVARLARIHPETALSRATRKFERRFRHMETRARESGRQFEEIPRQEKETLWEEAKKREIGE
jgi:tetrapyrrole methylase family protein/MazG family protein